MDASLSAALEGRQPLIFGAVEIALPGGGFIRLLDGAGAVTIGGALFTGRDPVFGALELMTEIEDGSNDEAPETTITLLPPGDAAAIDLSSPAMQGQSVRVIFGAVDPVTGTVIGTPEPVFVGEVDVPAIVFGPEGRRLELSCVSGFERYFETDEGIRLSDPWHQSVWPGELGLAFVTGVEEDIYWGAERPRSGVATGGRTGAGGEGLSGGNLVSLV